jgi:hypothetical protein
LLAFNPSGSRLAVSHENADHVQVFDTRSGTEVTRLTGFTRVTAVLFLSAEVLLVAAFGGCFRCNLRRGGRDLLSPEGWQTSVTLSPDGIGLFQGMFDKNILTFNPGWDQNAQKLPAFTDVRELQRQLKSQGVQLVTEADESTTGPASFIAVDPDGNPILVDQHV